MLLPAAASSTSSASLSKKLRLSGLTLFFTSLLIAVYSWKDATSNDYVVKSTGVRKYQFPRFHLFF